MKLSNEDAALFFKLFQALLFYVNNQLEIVDKVSSRDEFLELSIKQKCKPRADVEVVRLQAFYAL
jgi:hypothetical protein